MSHTNSGPSRSGGSRKAALAVLPILFLLAARAPVQAQPGDLAFFKNYFVTGDYVVGGVNLRGTGDAGMATGTISMDGVPANADILAAFLYWQTEVTRLTPAGTAGATFRDGSITWGPAPDETIAKELASSGVGSCRNGWPRDHDGARGAGWHTSLRPVTKVYRADVLRFLPTGQDPTKPNYGKLLVNDADLINHGLPLHTVVLPDGGQRNLFPSTAGASLVVVYRDPVRPLNAIVIYDGGFTLDKGAKRLTQTVQGFYQAANHPSAKLTHIVGGGQPKSSERLFFNGQLLATNPFVGSASPGAAEPAWDNVTTDVSAYVAHAYDRSRSVTTSVDRGHASKADCLSWAAIIFSTTVQDSDDDGLLDIWESSTRTLYDFVNPWTGHPLPGAQALPNLRAMGADPKVQDIFLEIGYMTTSGYSNPVQGEVPAHSHLPAKQALDLVATAFRNAAPRRLKSSESGRTGPINIHFDVGANYQPPLIDPGTNQPYPALPTRQECQANWQPGCALIPATVARGGEEITESACQSNETGTGSCAFPDYPGTVGWKSAYKFYRDQPLEFPAPPPGIDSGEEACVAAGDACTRRFDRNRKDIFHYALFAHALGLPRSDEDDPATPFDERTTPKNTSGIADPPGGDLMVTLGFWDDYVGSPFIQASTLLHELGHNFGFRHGGPPLVTSGGSLSLQPNCKPNYQSAMNYLFQVRGLLNASGEVVLDYSRQALGVLDESGLNEAAGLATNVSPLAYLPRWFAPMGYIDQALGTTPATRHCDGTRLGANEIGLFRVDGTGVAGPIDWNADGALDGDIPPQDITFNGSISPLSAGSNDWSRIDLRQVGGRRNVGSQRIAGAMSLDLGFGDVGFGDVGFGDVGLGDVGFGDVGFGDVGFGDVGFGDVGFGDVGFGDVGAPLDDQTSGDVTFDTAKSVSNAPNLLEPVVDKRKRAVRLAWTTPHVGRAYSYDIWRVTGRTVTPDNFARRVLVATALNPATSFVDTRAKPGVTYTYFVSALLYDDEGVPSGRSGISNHQTVSMHK